MQKDQQEEPRLRLDVIAVFAGTSIVALTAVPWYGITQGFSPALWVLFSIFLMWNGLSITAGYHRLWSHKSYEAVLPVRIIFALGGALAVQNSIRAWCSNHRHHHQYVDDPARDPYAATRGLWYSHLGWMLKDYPAARVTESNIRDLDRDPVVLWQDRYYWILAFAMNVILTTCLGYLAGDALGGLLLLGFFRLVVSHHTTFFINSLAHYWGRQPYSDASSARDNGLIAMLTYGEGYHNFHHTFQWDYRNGLQWYQFDPTKWLIATLNLTRLAGNLKRTPPEQIERSMVNMQLKRARQAASSWMDADIWVARLEAEYNELIEHLNQWAIYRQQWVALRKQNLVDQASELKARLKEIEAELNQQRERWHNLRCQFA